MGLKERVIDHVRRKRQLRELVRLQESDNKFFFQSVARTAGLFNRIRSAIDVTNTPGNAFDLACVVGFLAEIDAKTRLSESEKPAEELRERTGMMESLRRSTYFNSLHILSPEEQDRMWNREVIAAYEKHARKAAQVIYEERHTRDDFFVIRVKREVPPELTQMKDIREGRTAGSESIDS